MTAKTRAFQEEEFCSDVMRIMLPYFTFLMLVVVIPSICLWVMASIDTVDLVKQLLRSAVGGEILVKYASVFWFPTCYLMCRLIYSYRLELFGSERVFLVVSVLVGLASIAASYAWPGFWLPWAINVVPVAILYFVAGRCIADIGFARLSRLHLPIMLLGGAGIYLACVGVISPVDMKFAAYGTPGLAIGAALFAAAGTVAIAEHLSRVAVVGRTLAFLGRASLVVMFVHQPAWLVLSEQGGIGNVWLLVAFALLSSLAVYVIAHQSVLLRAAVLGEVTAMRSTTHRAMQIFSARS